MSHFDTLAVTSGLHRDPLGAINTPIYATSTFRQPSLASRTNMNIRARPIPPGMPLK